MNTDRLGNCTHQHKSDGDPQEGADNITLHTGQRTATRAEPGERREPQNTWRSGQKNIETHGRSPANEESPCNSHPLRATSTSLWTSPVHADISLPAAALAETLAEQEEKTLRCILKSMTESREAPAPSSQYGLRHDTGYGCPVTATATR